jgi:hypothetical protein
MSGFLSRERISVVVFCTPEKTGFGVLLYNSSKCYGYPGMAFELPDSSYAHKIERDNVKRRYNSRYSVKRGKQCIFI